MIRPSTFLALAALAAWFVLLRPLSLGGPAGYEIVSGTSMEPLLHSGDLVITQRQATYARGDLIVYRVPSGQLQAGSLIVHRIVGGDGVSGFITKGDNKSSPDVWRPTQADVIGRSWVMLPASGDFVLVLRRPLVLAAIAGGLAAFWFLNADLLTPKRRKGSGPGKGETAGA